MKKILLIAIIISAACQLKAQQLSNKPSDPFLLKTPPDQTMQLFKPGDSTLFKNFQVLPKGRQLAQLPGKLQAYDLFAVQTSSNIDHMPILKVHGNIDAMPVAKPDGPIDRMPILKVSPLSQRAAANP